MKQRSIALLSTRYQETKTLRDNLFNTRNQAWVKKAKKMGPFWGYDTKGKKCILEFSMYGYSFNPVNDFYEVLMTTPNEDLPLFIFEEYEEPEERAMIEARLKGQKEFAGQLLHIPQCQDLVNEYLNLEIRFRHIYRVLQQYEELLTQKIAEKYQNKLYGKYGREEITLCIKIGPHKYVFSNRRHALELHKDVLYDKIQ